MWAVDWTTLVDRASPLLGKVTTMCGTAVGTGVVPTGILAVSAIAFQSISGRQLAQKSFSRLAGFCR
jgi:hypothetical protein